jgi:dihydrodipicolinate synthase/N-acetylneuraminate lyase
MTSSPVTLDDINGLFAVPPVPRRADRHLDFDAGARLVCHIAAGGVSRFLYGGNAFLYHVTLAEYEALLDWLASFPVPGFVLPGIGPSFGRALDQARLLRRYRFRCALMLPCSDPRDAEGLERGLREIADAAGLPLMLYLKSDDGFGSDRDRAIAAVGRLVDDGIAAAIKYAIVRPSADDDSYLASLVQRVDRRRVISGMGEKPAVVHFRSFDLGGLTTGSGCVAPRLSNALLQACIDHDWARAEALRVLFLPLEDLRDAWGPARVLHHAVELAGIASSGPIPPFVSALTPSQVDALQPVARALRERDA